MNAADWVAATGTAVVGRGPFRRPVNPRSLAAAMGKTMPLARTHHGAARRKQQLKIARLTAPVDMTPRRPRTRSLSEYEYARASMMDQARSDRIKQRYRRPDLG